MANCKNDFLGTLTVKLTSFEWKESSPRRSAPKISHTGILPRGGLVLSLEYVRPLFVKTKNLFLKFLKPSLLLPCALFTNILQETRIFYTKYVFTIIEGYFTCWLVESYGLWEFWPRKWHTDDCTFCFTSQYSNNVQTNLVTTKNETHLSVAKKNVQVC